MPDDTTAPPHAVTRLDLGSLATRAARRNPGGVAFVEATTGEETTFAAFERHAVSCAEELHDLGLGRGDVVAILARNSVEMYAAHFAALKLGAVTLFLNVDLTPSDLAYQLRDAGADAVVYDAEFSEKLAPYRDTATLEPALTTDRIAELGSPGTTDVSDGNGPTLADTAIEPSDTALILYTSGTTSRPKGVVHTHRSYSYGVVNTLVGGDVRQDEVQTAVLPLFHIHQDLWTKAALCVGATTVLYDEFEPESFLESVDRYDLTYLNLMASMYRRLVEFDVPEDDVASVRRCVHGMPMETSIRERVVESFDAELQKVYGQTEALIATFLDPEWQFEKPGNYVGEPTPFVEVAIMDDDGNLLDREETGEIVLRGPTVMEGYLNMPEKSASTWEHGWHHTDDVGLIDEDGLLFFVDREKDVVKTGGENVSSIKVENVVAEHPAVRECAVVGLPHAEWGEAITAFVTVRGDVPVEDLRAHCADHLARFERPKDFVVRSEFPYTSTGKITKSRLEAEYRDHYRDGEEG